MKKNLYICVAFTFAKIYNFLADRRDDADAVIKWAISRGGLEDEFFQVTKGEYDENYRG